MVLQEAKFAVLRKRSAVVVQGAIGEMQGEIAAHDRAAHGLSEIAIANDIAVEVAYDEETMSYAFRVTDTDPIRDAGLGQRNREKHYNAEQEARYRRRPTASEHTATLAAS